MVCLEVPGLRELEHGNYSEVVSNDHNSTSYGNCSEEVYVPKRSVYWKKETQGW